MNKKQMRKRYLKRRGMRISENKPPEEWVRKTARNLRLNAEGMCVKMSVESSRIAAQHIWRDGMKSKCRIKVIKKYSR